MVDFIELQRTGITDVMGSSERRVTSPLNSFGLREWIDGKCYDDALWEFDTRDNETNNPDTFISPR